MSGLNRQFAKLVYLNCVPGVRIPLSPQQVFICMKYEYDRIKIEFDKVQSLLDRMNELGADGWEVIHYEEKKPEKFGDKYESIVLFKRLKSCVQEKT